MAALPIQDPLFGELQSARAEGQTDLLWVGAAIFPPTGLPVTYQFQASAAGPTDGHREVLRQLHSRYADLLPRLLPTLVEAVTEEGEDPMALSSARLIEVWLPAQEDVAMEWDLTYEIGDTGLQYLVDMRGWTPVGAAVS